MHVSQAEACHAAPPSNKGANRDDSADLKDEAVTLM